MSWLDYCFRCLNWKGDILYPFGYADPTAEWCEFTCGGENIDREEFGEFESCEPDSTEYWMLLRENILSAPWGEEIFNEILKEYKKKKSF